MTRLLFYGEPNGRSPNLLNQYTSRTVPGAVDIMGVSFATNTVTVNGQAAYRKGEYFRKELPIANTAGPVWTNITVSATGQGSTNGHAFLPRTPEQFWYDTDGNLTNDGRWKYTWDAENRLVRMISGTTTGPQQRLDFGYDSQSRRITRKVWNNTAGSGTPALDERFVYDGWNLAAELNATNNAVVRAYMWGLDLSGSMEGAGGVGGLLAVADPASGTNFCCFDGNGNVTVLVSATNASTTAQYEYGPFGEVIRATGPMAKANPHRFSTKYQDDETDLLMYPRRPYSPSTGRWLSHDPSADLGTPPPVSPTRQLAYSDTLLSDEGEEDGTTELNPPAMLRPAYRFVDNDPIAHIDALGEDIYLQRGNNSWTANRWLHLAVCVDTWQCSNRVWEKRSKVCFSFAMTGFGASFPSNKWLGWSEVNAGGLGKGRIYVQDYISPTVVTQIKTTRRQDLTWMMYMFTSRVGLKDTYSVARHNCRRYSKYEFRDAPLHMGLP